MADVDVRQRFPHGGPLHLDGVDAVIVDFNEVEAAVVLGILRAQQDLKVVTVNAAGSAVTVLTGCVYLAQSLADVVGCVASAHRAVCASLSASTLMLG